MNNQQPWFWRELNVARGQRHLLFEAEQSVIDGLKRLGYELIVGEDGKSCHRVFKKDEVTIEFDYNRNDGSHELVIFPEERGLEIYWWILNHTLMVSAARWELTGDEFWKGQVGSFCFFGKIKEILCALVAAGYKYHPNQRATLKDEQINLLKLSKGGYWPAVQIAYSSLYLKRNDWYRDRIWIFVIPVRDIFEVMEIVSKVVQKET